ncbi:ras-specific guanine nucleotide-releasing factor RalGPS1-like isoform X2 [Battus philenor]|uniref:ras-specific guanine nucleotide-releasing factor RalGPS1-like isoform X2 n=1 Tax=Battus philenor TaxID=42288 RepID=UPI0035CF55FD
MPRDIISDSLAVLRIIEHEDEENWPLEDKTCCKQTNKKIANVNTTTKCQEILTKNDSACYFNYGHGDGTNNRQHDPLYQYKTSSLPAASSINQSWDEIVCSALRVSPEDIANQLSLLDLPCFKAIQPEELTTCGWNKLNKLTVAPNVVAFTKRFNRVSFWTVQEILNGQSPKARAETLAHFIKVAKKLHELNNLHSLFAIISALHSASIYRLTKTWACLSKKDKQQFDKMAELFGEKDNWMALREYLRSISPPCIPYLGIFLTDLVYIDMAHPAGSPHRASKMAVVLRALQRYQTSQYNIAPLPHVANYLNSVRYIEELQKFLEDDHYKLSLKLEPPSPVGSRNGSKESVKEAAVKAAGCSGGVAGNACVPLSPTHRLGSASVRLQPAYQPKFIPTHRKCRSLGSNIFGKGQLDERGAEGTPTGSVNLLDDTLLESPGADAVPTKLACLPHSVLSEVVSMQCDFQSYVRRKTILKEGRKISLSSWQRFWLELAGTVLVFYASKSFKGTSRGDFRAERCKVVPLAGWTAFPEPPDCFQLLHRRAGTLYKFKTGSESIAKQWVAKIEEVSNNMEKPLPANLMSFE